MLQSFIFREIFRASDLKSVAGVLLVRLLVLVTFTLCMTLSASAQTGPGGVGNSVNNVLWLSADHGVYQDAGTTPAANGQDVRQWSDRSGNNKHAGEGSVGNQPNYVTGQLNGNPVIRYTGGTGGDRLMSSGLDDTNAASTWVVARYSALLTPNPGLMQGYPFGANEQTPANKSVGVWVSSASPFRVWGRGIQSDGTTRDISSVTALSANTTYIINTVFGSAINQYVLSQTAGNNASHNGTLQSWSEFLIGCQANESWNGDIAEVIVFNTAVNEAQRIIIDNYLAAKYGLALAVNDVYDEDTNGNFDFDVAGIGRATGASNAHTDAQGGIVRVSNPVGLGDNEYYIWGHDNQPLTPTTSNLPSGVIERLNRTWRGSRAGTINSVSVSVDLTGIGNPSYSDLRLIVDTDNDGQFSDETTGTGGVITATSANGSVYTFTGVTALTNNRRFTFGTVITPLPVELLSFAANEKHGAVVLTWSTASELNNNHFTLERSRDGIAFELMAKIDGAGTTIERNDYKFTDAAPFAGRSYYRLSQTDFDGTTEYFSLASVEIDLREFAFSVFPNPSPGGEFGVVVSHAAEGKPLTLSVCDLRGVEVFRQRELQPVGKTSESFNVHTGRQLQPGVYLVKVVYGSALFTEKLVVR